MESGEEGHASSHMPLIKDTKETEARGSYLKLSNEKY
jgi:hypothetical protein